jgi:uncharacterized protein (UPF0261 family)
VVFHSTGMGGAAMEALIAQGEFVAVFDFLLQEIGNHLHGSVVSAGPHRLQATIERGVPLFVAPGCLDMIDVPAWQALPESLKDRPYHAHNRLIASYLTTPSERAEIARHVAERLNKSTGPVHFFLPLHGLHEWDKAGAPLRDEVGQAALVSSFKTHLKPPVQLLEVDAHINDAQFIDVVMDAFDEFFRPALPA